MPFTFDGEVFDYADYAYNTTRLNERAVEIPLARRFIATNGIDLEVGNVLCHYGHDGHQVVDRYEQGENIDNIDVFDVEGRVSSVVSISTVEHVRWDEPRRDPQGAIRAVEHLREIADHVFITVGLGQHPRLDEYLMAVDANASTLIRDGDNWVQTDEPVWLPYAKSTRWAESVWIGEWHDPTPTHSDRT